MKAVAVIPARYASNRLPGKPLLDICGKPLIQHVWELVSRVHGLEEVVVATDDTRIADAVEAFGGNVCMTSTHCQSGSDRVREVAESLAADVYVNVQGDEPLLEPSAIEALLAVFARDESVQVATLCSRISEEQAKSPHQVKVVRDHARNALYFSRAPLPFVRDADVEAAFLGHIGIYAYRSDALRSFAALPQSPLEQAEKLEQLRFLQAGVSVRVLEVPPMGAGVDTTEDLERVRAIFGEREHANPANAGTVAMGTRYRGAAADSVADSSIRTGIWARPGSIRLVITDVDGVLTDGGLYDEIIIPRKTDVVHVSGEVLIPAAVTWEKGLSLKGYLSGAGGLSDRADAGNILIVGLNGEVARARGQAIKPGDRILVMPRFDSKNL